MIEVERLHKQFGGVAAVTDISFQVQDSTITGLLGSNGAGKPQHYESSLAFCSPKQDTSGLTVSCPQKIGLERNAM
jgi:ABC-type uncharacterized transport system ATPase subunit